MKKWINASTVATIILIGGVASAEDKDQAQESSGRSSRLGAATHSAELTIGTGYAQGFGKAGSGEPSLTDVGKAGGGVQAGVAYRLYPQLALGVYGSWAIYGRGDQADPTGNEYSATAGVQGDWHFLPAGYEFDPWVSLGSGWRGYWETADRGTTAMHGWEIAKLQVGAAYVLAAQAHLTTGHAIGPSIKVGVPHGSLTLYELFGLLSYPTETRLEFLTSL